MTISIILPVYNEVKSLEHVISNWSKYLIEKKLTHEFVICEDGSTDGTKELIKILKNLIIFQINLLKIEEDMGKVLFQELLQLNMNLYYVLIAMVSVCLTLLMNS